MIKINIVSIGKIKEKFYTEAINEYAKRLSKYCEFNVIELAEKSQESNITKKIDEESSNLLNACKGTIILLDRQGTKISSTKLAQIIELTSNTSSTISFVIGGSNGVNSNLIQKADYCISFGEITFPHQLFRVVLAEQIYRAFTIINKTPYHK